MRLTTSSCKRAFGPSCRLFGAGPFVALTTPGVDFPASERSRLSALAQPPTALDRRRLFLHVEAQLLKRALRDKDLAILSTCGGRDTVESRLAATRDALVDLRGVANLPTDVFFWTTRRLVSSAWSATPGSAGPARSNGG